MDIGFRTHASYSVCLCLYLNFHSSFTMRSDYVFFLFSVEEALYNYCIRIYRAGCYNRMRSKYQSWYCWNCMMNTSAWQGYPWYLTCILSLRKWAWMISAVKTNWLKEWFTSSLIKTVICLILEWISVFEWIVQLVTEYLTHKVNSTTYCVWWCNW